MNEEAAQMLKEFNAGNHVTLREINSSYVGKKIVLEGKVVGISDPEIIPISYSSRCDECGEISKNKRKCSECQGTLLTNTPSELADLQVIKLHEVKPKDNHIAKMVVIARGKEALWKARAGQRLQVTGEFKIDSVQLSLDGKEKPVKRLEATEVKILDNIEVKLTEADITRIKDMVTDPLHWQILIDSFAPHLYGLEEMKQVCIYTLGSCGTTRPFNALLGGPPGRGKTWLLEFTAAMHPVGIKLTIRGASLAGLTSATVRDEDTGAYVTNPGLFVLYDGGVVCLTELQSIKNLPALKDSLNDSLESKEVSGAKADGPIKLQARCAVIFDTNNYTGGWDYGMSLAHNMKFMEPNLGPFISRLDLVSISPQMESDEFYANVARSNFSVTGTEEGLEKFKDDYEVDGIPRYGVDTLRKYFAYITTQPLPPLSETCKEKFIENFVKVNKEAKEYTIDGRYNRIVKTLAQIRARLFLKQEADEDDLELAILAVNESKDIETKDADGNDANASLGLPSKKAIEVRENQESQFMEAFKLAEQEKGEGNATERDIVAFLCLRKWDETKAERFTHKYLNQSGKFLESSGHWRRI